MPSEADRLAADGSPITLADGTHHLRYGMRGIKMLQDSFGSLKAVNEYLRAEGEPRIAPLMDLLAAGLHRDGITADALLDLADSRQIQVYLDAAVDALSESLPSSAEVDDADPKASVTPSPGSSSTTSPPSALVGATSSSGT